MSLPPVRWGGYTSIRLSCSSSNSAQYYPPPSPSRRCWPLLLVYPFPPRLYLWISSTITTLSRVCPILSLLFSQLDAVVLLPDQLAWLLTFFFSWRETPFDFGRYNLDHYTLFTFSPFSPRPARLVLVSWNHCTTAGHSFLLDIPECPDTPRAPSLTRSIPKRKRLLFSPAASPASSFCERPF